MSLLIQLRFVIMAIENVVNGNQVKFQIFMKLITDI